MGWGGVRIIWLRGASITPKTIVGSPKKTMYLRGGSGYLKTWYWVPRGMGPDTSRGVAIEEQSFPSRYPGPCLEVNAAAPQGTGFYSLDPLERLGGEDI